MPRERPTENWPELIPGVQAGSEAAEERLYLVFCAIARPYLTSRLGPDRAEDILHDAFIRVLTAIRRGTVTKHEAAGKYLLLVGVRQAADEIKRRRYHPDGAVPPADSLGPVEFRDPERAAIASELVRHCLQEMTPDERAVICDDRINREVGRSRRCSTTTIQRIRQAARQKAYAVRRAA